MLSSSDIEDRGVNFQVGTNENPTQRKRLRKINKAEQAEIKTAVFSILKGRTVTFFCVDDHLSDILSACNCARTDADSVRRVVSTMKKAEKKQLRESEKGKSNERKLELIEGRAAEEALVTAQKANIATLCANCKDLFENYVTSIIKDIPILLLYSCYLLYNMHVVFTIITASRQLT